MASQPTVAPNLFPTERTNDLPFFDSNPFTVEALDSQKKAHVSPCPKSSSSAPTALSLLLRSSMFNKLVKQQNLNTNYDEAEENDTEEMTEIVSSNGGAEMLCNEVDHIPFKCSSNRGILPGLESEETTLSFKTGQSLWNGTLDLLTNNHEFFSK